ncbi:hypothetical protein [Candidatus Sulfurimonas baltica]|uniref:Uncharacterized protein n=1 Tax=Candidatus Sulfurimonas baltica TaxID=2740404 RepID=A0A7S7LUY5_9BACT|nr:hypothetical protein [Candidatus Sulfurimonas baltica]QOY51969.1 hypothetical protein HUE88_12895 [Candidatus Sulfurimonas baltica]
MNELRINSFIKILKDDKSVHFSYNEHYYEIFESITDSGYIVNVYSSDEKDEGNDYIDKYLIDGGICTGSAIDAIYFML